MTPTQKAAMERAFVLLGSAHVSTDLIWERNDCCDALRAALAEQSGSKDKQAMTIKLPPLGPHDHPDPRSFKWDEMEIRAIQDYAREAVRLNMAPLSDSFSLEEIADACIYAEIPDGQFQSVLIALHDNRRHGIKGD
jgi:hypothetical protein